MNTHSSRFGIGDFVKFRTNKGDEPKFGIVTQVKFYKPTTERAVAYDIEILNTRDHANSVLENLIDCHFVESKA